MRHRHERESEGTVVDPFIWLDGPQVWGDAVLLDARPGGLGLCLQHLSLLPQPLRFGLGDGRTAGPFTATLAGILAREMGVEARITSGPVIDRW